MRRYTIRIDQTEHILDVGELTADTFAVVLADGRRVEVSITEHHEVAHAVIGPHIHGGLPPQVAPSRPTTPPPAVPAHRAARPGPSAPGSGVLTAPMPGVVIEVAVAVGDAVASGQTLLVLEAMKMRNELRARQAGLVRRIEVKAGDQVRHGEVLLEIAS